MASPEVENDYLGDEGLKKLVARVKQADIAIASALDRHTLDHDNPHRVTAEHDHRAVQNGNHP